MKPKKVKHYRVHTFDKTVYTHACGDRTYDHGETSCCSTHKSSVTCSKCSAVLKKTSKSFNKKLSK